MEDYAKMYAVLCGAIDDVIDELERLPEAAGCAQRLKDALLQAEEIYCSGEKASPSGTAFTPAEPLSQLR